MKQKIYADKTFYENKLKKIMKKLDVDKFFYKWEDDVSFVKFKYKNKWYQIKHSLKRANYKRTYEEKLSYGSDLFAQIVLTLESLVSIKEYNICNFEDWLVTFQLKYDNNLPECFHSLGYIGSEVPKVEEVMTKIEYIKKLIGIDSVFYNKETYNKLLEIEQECISYYKK